MTDQTITQQIESLRLLIRGSKPATDALNALAESIELMEKRYADREALRLGDVVRRGMTPEAYYAAVRESQKDAPSLWVAVYTGPTQEPETVLGAD